MAVQKKIDQTWTFTVRTFDPTTKAPADADSVPAYRIYEDETGTPILTGNMAKLDDAGSVGQYSEQVTCSAANGFEVGKDYVAEITATVDGTDGATERRCQIIPSVVDANTTQIEGADATDVIDARIQAFFGANLAALMASFGARVLQTGGAFDVTPDRFMRVVFDALAGETTGFPGPAIEVKKSDGSGDPRIASTVDAYGNRVNTIDPD